MNKTETRVRECIEKLERVAKNKYTAVTRQEAAQEAKKKALTR